MTDITRSRGDTYPMEFTVKSDGVPLDITSCSFMLTVDPSKEPVDDTNNLWAIAGNIESAPGGTVSFSMNSTQADHLGKYFYDLQMIDAAGYIRTIQKGKFNFVQDITKVE
jgi:hypothetical protein